MKGRSVLLGQIGGRRAAALTVDGLLDDLLIDGPADGPPAPGTIYRAIVDRPVKGQGAVFVRLPGGSGFVRQAKGLAQGQAVMAQVTGHAEDGKAVPLTLKLLFKSKYAIVTPMAPGLNISRAIRDDEERARLRALSEGIMEGSPAGLILRSQAEGADADEIAEDIAEMRSQAEALLEETDGGAECLLEGPDSHHTAWREWGEPDEVITEDAAFEVHDVLDQIAQLADPESPLPGGGSIVVEPTRALVAVDVNTGPDTSPAAALKANLAAARALPRALRLRGLGGQIVIDFAPVAKKDRRIVEQALRAAFRSDPVETAQVGWTPLGHFELSRKRERLPLDTGLLETL